MATDQADIFKGLDRAFKTAHSMSMELDSLRICFFSDLHRGTGDGADDFRRCARAYNTALAYYLADGYTLCLLGDAEELWECRPGPIIQQYRHTFELERKFRDAGRYWRIWGNHDDLWSFPEAVKEYLGPIGLDVPFWESLLLEVTDHGTPLGELFLLHGHQGTTASDKFGRWSRVLVRYGWRNWQRLTNMASTTPAKDWKLRKQHDAAMYRWALSMRERGLITFTGHTHRPVFRAQSLVDRLTRELDMIKREGNGPEHLEELQALEAELEWVRSGEFQTSAGIEMEAPCYFNTGCSSFGDGDVTGLTIKDGKVQLVRWPDNADRPLPQVLETADLRECFAEVRGLRPARGEATRSPQPSPSPEGAALH